MKLVKSTYQIIKKSNRYKNGSFKLIVVYFFSVAFGFAQVPTDSVYTSLTEAVKKPLEVYYLDLHKQKLTAFPMEILQFKNLKTLDISKNKIDVLPSEIDELGNLERLNVSKNSLYTFPVNIGRLAKLKYLIANKNHIAFLPEQISGAQSLIKIDLWKNEMTGLPTSIVELKQLEVLDLRENIFDREAQALYKKLLPNIRLYFSAACACGK